MRITKSRALVPLLLAGGLLAAACGSSSSSSTTTTTSGGSSGGATVSVTTFNKNFTTMTDLKSVTSAGHGKVAVILPDTVSSARYTEFDAPYLTQAFAAAGLSTSDTIIQNAQGSDSTQLTDAQSDITSGATVLVVDPLDAGVGTSIESYATAHGVPVVDYDRLVLGGSRKYYVSFDNVKVGTLIGNGMVSCIASWKVAKPTLAVMVGSPTDNNATLFAQGYNAVLKPLVTAGTYSVVANPAGTWDPPTALTEFQQAYTAHPTMNAVLVPNDENAAPIISYLKTLNIPAKKFPVTGQDATLDRYPERDLGLPVRHGLQAHLPRGPGGRRAGPVPAGRQDAAGRPGERLGQGHHGQRERALVAAGPRVGHPDQRAVHRRRRRIRPRLAAVHRCLRSRLHHLRDPLTGCARRT